MEPADFHVEKCFLYAILDAISQRNYSVVRDAASLVDATMFRTEHGGVLFSAVERALESSGEAISTTSLLEALAETASGRIVDGIDPALHTLVEIGQKGIGTAPLLGRYADAMRREVLVDRARAAARYIDDAVRSNQPDRVAARVADAAFVLQELDYWHRGGCGGSVDFDSACEQFLTEQNAGYVKTDLHELDHALGGGLPVGGLTSFVAEPGIGKSALALQATISALFSDPSLVAVWGLGEMSPSVLVRRSICCGAALLGLGDILMADAKERKPEAIAAMRRVQERLGGRLKIQPAPLTCHAMDSAVQKSGARLLVIDYLQLVAAPGFESKTDQLDDVLSSLKALAINRNCAILVVSNMAKATLRGQGGVGTIIKGTSEGDYACDFLFVGSRDPNEPTPPPLQRSVLWRCVKARNEQAQDFEMLLDGSRQYFGSTTKPFEDFAGFAQPPNSANGFVDFGQV